jgi:DNA-binding CsgD family transcriptional regulator
MNEMSEMDENENENGNGNEAKKSGAGRKVGATQIATLHAQAEAVRLMLEGKSTPEIARILGRAEVTIYGYLRDARYQLIAAKRDHFNKRIALYLDQTLDGLAMTGELLSDRQFLETTDPARIDVIARSYGILSDKCFILLAGARDLALAGAGPETPPGAPAAGDAADRAD